MGVKISSCYRFQWLQKSLGVYMNPYMSSYNSLFVHMTNYEFLRLQMGSYVALWLLRCYYDSIGVTMTPYDILWFYMNPISLKINSSTHILDSEFSNLSYIFITLAFNENQTFSGIYLDPHSNISTLPEGTQLYPKTFVWSNSTLFETYATMHKVCACFSHVAWVSSNINYKGNNPSRTIEGEGYTMEPFY